MQKFRFRNFQVYKDALEYQEVTRKISKQHFPKEEMFSLTDQLRRASYSIILNIAEGADRGTDKDFAYFLNISHTSLNETVACFDIANKNSYISDAQRNELLEKSERLANQITSFRKSLLDNPTK